jgi:DMSO/TMAO reductase YedYZ molybdopterin-dependent catalytic subunit
MVGFRGRAREHDDRVPPGQYVTRDFPVLTAGPTEVVPTDRWQLTVTDGTATGTFDWDGLHAFGLETLTTDIHCVTHWSKLGTTWRGVRVSTLLDVVGVDDLPYAVVTSYGGYTTNLPLEDLVDRDAMVAVEFEGEPLAAEHGGPARLLVPHLYLWKSAKWVTRIELVEYDTPGFWEVAGYHNHGDPFLEQRYHGD